MFAHFFNGLHLVESSLCWSVFDYQSIYNEIRANVHILHCISFDFLTIIFKIRQIYYLNWADFTDYVLLFVLQLGLSLLWKMLYSCFSMSFEKLS